MAVIDNEKSIAVDGVASTDISNDGEVVDLNDTKADRHLTNKLDLKVVPIFGLLYVICFLDRTNIANAKLTGLEKGTGHALQSVQHLSLDILHPFCSC